MSDYSAFLYVCALHSGEPFLLRDGCAPCAERRKQQGIWSDDEQAYIKCPCGYYLFDFTRGPQGHTKDCPQQ